MAQQTFYDLASESTEEADDKGEQAKLYAYEQRLYSQKQPYSNRRGNSSLSMRYWL